MNRSYLGIALLIVFMSIFSGCGPGLPADVSATPNPEQPVSSDTPLPTPTPAAGPHIEGQAVVDVVDLLIMESFPVQVSARVTGSLPDGCTQIGRHEQAREGNLITVRLFTTRPADTMCSEALVPFEHAIGLDVLGLPAGDYQVTVNGVENSFNLAMDNVSPES